ncbi:(d)CMP kinase [Hydrogeniiclostridium mannosilyticum]|uniref:(d)CMP kinase n=1 Tax=Hydrogeniiclostridium mannosilyticum TaxID=2764322 RepID=UPI003999749A
MNKLIYTEDIKMFAIAIDGPAGAGKSTIAKDVSKRLGYIYVDTGALYRAVGLHMLRRGITAAEPERVEAELKNIDVTIHFQDGNQLVLLNEEDVSGLIRTPEVSMAASTFSALPSVREFLFDLQQELAAHNNVVMDGRDIGTVVLPKAQVKIFLTASPEERARRRLKDLEEAGKAISYEEVLKDVKERDYNDSHRAISPLLPAADAVHFDNTGYTLEQSVEKILALVRAKDV